MSLKIDAKHLPELRKLVEREGITPEEAAARIAVASCRTRKTASPATAPRKRRSRRPPEPKELGREATAEDYHRLITERAFTTQTIKLAEGYGWYVFHDQDSRKNVAGFPDLFLCHPERGIVFVELKTETGRVRKEQRAVLRMIRAAGGRAFICRPRHRDALEALLAGRDPGDKAFEIPDTDKG